ncbi:MAG TPA: Npt1/Npt2 family nucleotide transporter, partial [Rhabdochlamydiaceae bacterium]|nr:Npt1/Npt2 family nucleotide transporter [Rhabdochlamydiaceae bacterium]
MFKEKLNLIKQELRSYSSVQRIFILCAMLCGFCISAEYAIVRPVSNSVFIHSYSSNFFPYAWLACVPLNLLIVSLYNRYLPRFGCLKMCYTILLTVMGGNVFFALFLNKIACLPFLFYIWKEIYVLLMFQQLWSVIHSTIEIKKAKYLYGIIFGVGGAGAVIGSLIPSFLAVKMGSETLLFLGIPFYCLLLFFYSKAVKNSDTLRSDNPLRELKEKSDLSFFSSLKSIRNSRFLIFIACIVVFMQLSATIIDFQFNSVLEQTIPDKDLRTQFCGRVLALVQLTTISLQVFGTFLLVHLLGLRRSHQAVPLTLCANAIGFLLFPVFQMISFSYVTIKASDFSLFGVIKEMLYIPLKIDEKFRAKAIID